MEQSWLDLILQRETPAADAAAGEDSYEAAFTLGAGETLAEALAALDRTAAETAKVVRGHVPR